MHATRRQVLAPGCSKTPIQETDKKAVSRKKAPVPKALARPAEHDVDPDDPELTRPMPRYNAMLAVLRNTLYMCAACVCLDQVVWIADLLCSYGGIFERGKKEYTLDDFHALQLDKLDRFTCLKPSDVVIDRNADDESSDDDDDDDDEDDNGDDGDTMVGEAPDEVQQLSKKPDDLQDIVEEVEVLNVTEAEEVRSNTASCGPSIHIE